MSSVKVLVLGSTGSGKSSSICKIPELGIEGLSPESTYIIACATKELPVRGWLRDYIPSPAQAQPDTGNYKRATSGTSVANTMTHVSQNRPDIQTIVVDDMNYIMQDKYMDNRATGYKIFTDIGNEMAMIFRAVGNSTKNIIVMMHHEAVDETYETTYKAKTVGKMVDNYLTIEGKFSNVLFCKQMIDPDSRKVMKVFVTNYDGQYPAKTPVGAFTDVYIKNDMGFVLATLQRYFAGE